ncbi:MAG: 5-(carboxyamino)imidazole ribonucleotide mutase [Selenomonadaceae bacterium]|nr:5-(carboxyamino)imidazole ribonucleotide mutase [Selenomonadaceae bacterium]
MEVSIIMGSDSDWNIMKKAVEVFKNFGVESEIIVASAHRTPEKVHDFVKNSDAKIFIAAAGMAAHLAGVVASLTTKPVIGVPIKSEPFDGLDSLLSTVQMPSGIPVATVAVNGSKNAALLAVEILALSDKNLAEKLSDYRKNMAEEVEKKSEKIQAAFSEM